MGLAPTLWLTLELPLQRCLVPGRWKLRRTQTNAEAEIGVAVDGHPLNVLGATSCNIQLGGHNFLADVIVMEALTEE